ncbi:alanine racemase [Paenibacillus arenilitoris]|uniref:Alanine racemase n=1 Tax=Paenibacillus arenilitoris TaxID=2772299 RepID=A0A927CKG3_9BACL|nr:alanine racemase [Paenibacillus arenilitoris]MBD2869728.1 alanine racemase [Paenibacillus arenilitoris]
MFRVTRAEVRLGKIRDNMKQIRCLFPDTVKLMAVVKADGYGHGDAEAARMAEQGGADALAVAYLNEALRLRAQGITLPILILTPIEPQEVPLAEEHELMLTVTSGEWFREMRRYRNASAADKLKVHVKADTGLGRIGLRSKEEWDELAPWLHADDIVVDGFFTHFATASNEDTTFLTRQRDRFAEMIEWVEHSGVAVNHYHCAGSAAALRFPELAMDMVRIGAAMFGFYPERLVPSVKLEPALSLRSRLMQVKQLRKGEYIGYDNSYRADGDEWIGTVPIGYADGWSQGLQGTQMLVNGKRATVVGKICMDQLMLRLPGPCEEGAEVTIIGSQGDERITCAELARHIGTVPQEISASIAPRVSKVYKE